MIEHATRKPTAGEWLPYASVCHVGNGRSRCDQRERIIIMEFISSAFGSSVSEAGPSRAQDLEFTSGFASRHHSTGLASSCRVSRKEGYRELRTLNEIERCRQLREGPNRMGGCHTLCCHVTLRKPGWEQKNTINIVKWILRYSGSRFQDATFEDTGIAVQHWFSLSPEFEWIGPALYWVGDRRVP